MKANNKQSLSSIILATIGIVYGDISTSPLYTLRECLSGQFGFGVERDAVFGLLSLIFWLLILIVSIKYLIFVMRADNNGEGGILTLMSLVSHNKLDKVNSFIVIIGLIGSSFFYGESVITPAISIMSAIEGLKIITPNLNSCIVPLSIIVLTFLFFIQKHGTEVVGKLFSPIMLIWLLILAVLGLHSIAINSDILNAINPIWAINFFLEYKTVAFIALGTAALSITGIEALYADMGHFGKLPIRIAWFIIVLPSLILNYFGQGALLLRHPDAIKNPFFLLAPDWALIPMLTIATLATIIASQSVISGVFSLTKQAVHLGYLSPMKIIHTSEIEPGQIYIPFVNWLLYFSVVIIIFSFGCSSNLAAVYGIAVTGTMTLTSILSTTLAYREWHWNKFLVGTILISFLFIDIPLFFANFDKIIFGGWLPLMLSLAVFIIMTTWKSECFQLFHRMNKYDYSLQSIIDLLEKSTPTRVSGTAVYMSRSLNDIPFSLMHNIKHNKILHERIILLTIQTKDVPYIYDINRIQIKKLSLTFWSVIANYGWCETPNVEEIFYCCKFKGLYYQQKETSFFLSRKLLIIGKRPWYLRLRGKLYLILQRNASRVSDQFKIPSNRIIELGTQIEI